MNPYGGVVVHLNIGDKGYVTIDYTQDPTEPLETGKEAVP